VLELIRDLWFGVGIKQLYLHVEKNEFPKKILYILLTLSLFIDIVTLHTLICGVYTVHIGFVVSS